MRRLGIAFFLFVTVTVAVAQSDPAAGILPFSTQVGGQYDSIDLASSNISLIIPVMQKNGKFPFSYQLVGNFHAFPVRTNTSFFYEISAGVLSNPGGGLAGTPLAADLGAGRFGGPSARRPPVPQDLGVWVSYTISYFECTLPDGSTGYGELDNNFAVVDATGAAHSLTSFSVQINEFSDVGGCGDVVDGSPGVTTDGSGYTLAATLNNPPTGYSLVVYDRSGNQQSAVGVAKDPDGVQASYSKNPTTKVTTYTDTLGQPVLISTPGNILFNNGASDVYAYADVSGDMQTNKVTVHYQQYYQKTNFGCGSGTDFNTPGLGYFPTSVVLADGETYGISYEATPSFPQDITGRIATITLPNGGTITYQYLGANHGIVCGFGVVPTLTRTINDDNGHSGTWTYVSSVTTEGTTIFNTVTQTDPLGDITTYKFVNGYQTEKTLSDVTLGVLSTTVTCYNGNNSSQAACISPASLGSFIYQTDIYTTVGTSSSPSLVETTFDHQTSQFGSFGDALSVKRYDFGATYPPSGTPTSETDTTYANVNGVTCGPISSNIYDHPCTITNLSSGTIVSQVKYTYNAGGHATQTSRLVTGSNYLTSTATYNTNGTIASFTDVNNTVTNPAVTHYYYNGTGGCNNLLLTSTALPVNSLTTSQTWNCFGGVPKSSTDVNSKVTTYGYLDQNGVADPLWRRLSVTDPLNNVTWTKYSPGGTLPATVETSLLFNNAASSADLLNTEDGLGRPYLKQTKQAPSSSNYDTVVTTYDALGRIVSVGLPCSSTASQPCSSATTTTTYDALNRPLQVTDGGGGYTKYTITSKNDLLVAVGPPPATEALKQRQLEYDGLGRLTSVCEILSSGGSSCTQGATASGYKTSYAYSAPSIGESKMVVTQGVQTRTYVYDGLDRLISETNPESGTTQYLWDSAPTVCGGGGYPTPGDLGAKEDNAGVYTCYGYDPIHRLLGSGPSNSTKCSGFTYDSATPPSGVTVQYTKGKMIEAYTNSQCNGHGSIVTDQWFGYDADGRATDMYESTLNSGGFYHIGKQYWANGEVQQLSGIPGVPTIYYGASDGSGLDGEGRLTKVTDATGQSLLAQAVYNNGSDPQNPVGALTQVTYGSGDSDQFSYYTTTGRMKGYQYNVGTAGQAVIGQLTWNSNGTLGQFQVTQDPYNPANVQLCTYGYDDLARIANAKCGTTWSQTFTYDAFGNITKSGSSSWMPTYATPSNNKYLPGWNGVSYDADGNLTADSFHTYQWDANGHMVSNDSSTFTYDGIGHMAEASWGDQYLYDTNGALLGGSHSQAAAFFAHIRLPGGGVAAYASGSLSEYKHSDWLGSARFSSTPARALNYDIAFAPFGEPYTSSHVGNIFAGMEQVVAADEYETSAREYNTSQGRWITPDPAGFEAVDPANPQTWNRYAYVLNNPLSAIDPTGLWCVWEDGTHDPDPVDGDSSTTSGACATAGGHWDPHDTITGILTDDDGNVTRINTLYGSYNGMGMTLEGFDQTLKDYSVLPVNTATISAGTLNQLNDYCSARGRARFIADWLPGGGTIARTLWGSNNGAQLGFYQLSRGDLNNITEENNGGQTIALHTTSEGLKAAGENVAFLTWLRGATGLPKTIASTWLGRLSVAVIVADASSGFYKEGKEILNCQAGN